jgi:signal peptidase I
VLTETNYNQGHREPSEAVRPTADLRLSFRVARISGSGSLWVRASDGCEEFAVRVDPAARQVQAFRNGRPVGTTDTAAVISRQGSARIDVSLIDQQFLAAWDGSTIVSLPYHRGERYPSEHPFGLGCQALRVELEDLLVCRDLDYGTPQSGRMVRRMDSKIVGSIDEYYVVGDNTPISADSRTWPRDRALSAECLIGKPFVVLLPIQWGHVGPWRFRIPDLSAIRYIR